MASLTNRATTSATLPMKTVLLIFVIALTSIGMQAQKTTRRALKTTRVVASDTIDITSDTIRNPAGLIEIYGYDKPLNSGKETFHATNNSDLSINTITVDITYFDYLHRELHRRTATVRHDIPPGATRLLSLPSWDVQNSFYYIHGPTPRRKAFPFDVTIEVLEITGSADEEP